MTITIVTMLMLLEAAEMTVMLIRVNEGEFVHGMLCYII